MMKFLLLVSGIIFLFALDFSWGALAMIILLLALFGIIKGKEKGR